jgi:hypothetical protein
VHVYFAIFSKGVYTSSEIRWLLLNSKYSEGDRMEPTVIYRNDLLCEAFVGSEYVVMCMARYYILGLLLPNTYRSWLQVTIALSLVHILVHWSSHFTCTKSSHSAVSSPVVAWWRNLCLLVHVLTGWWLSHNFQLFSRLSWINFRFRLFWSDSQSVYLCDLHVERRPPWREDGSVIYSYNLLTIFYCLI